MPNQHRTPLSRDSSGRLAPRVSDAQVVEIRQRRADGESHGQLAEAFSLPVSYVGQLVRGKRRAGAGGRILRAGQVNASCRMIEIDGVRISEKAWAKRMGLPYSALRCRLYHGWDEREAVLTPLIEREVREIVIPPGPSTAYVPLDDDCKRFVLINRESAALLQGRNWQPVRVSGKTYAQAFDWRDGEPHCVLLKHLLLNPGDGGVVDAINRNNLDCRLVNLRVATKAQSVWRSAKRSTNTSGYVGVSWRAAKGKWSARLYSDGIRYWLGYHSTKEEAAAAVDRKIMQLRGEFGVLNLPVEVSKAA